MKTIRQKLGATRRRMSNASSSSAANTEKRKPSMMMVSDLMESFDDGEPPVTLTGRVTLHQAAREGNLGVMKALLRRSSLKNIMQMTRFANKYDENRLTPLHYAARYHQLECIKLLIGIGADVSKKGEDNLTPLHMLAKYKNRDIEGSSDSDTSSSKQISHKEMMAFGITLADLSDEEETCLNIMLDAGASMNDKDTSGHTPLHYAASKGNTPILKEMLRSGVAPVESSNSQGMTAMHLACAAGQLESVQLLFKAGVSLLCEDRVGSIPLHVACQEGCFEIVKYLLTDRSTPDPESPKEKSPGEGSKVSLKSPNRYQPEVTNDLQSSQELIIQMMQYKDSAQNLPLHFAIENGSLDIVQLFLAKTKEYGLESLVNECREGDESCLHIAVAVNSLDIVRVLLEESASVTVENISYQTPLYLACKQNLSRIADVLLDAGADIEHTTPDSITPLMIASRFGNLDCVSLLLRRGADVRKTDNDEKTVLMLAAEENREDALKLLLTNSELILMLEDRDKFNNTALHLASRKGHSETVKLLMDNDAMTESKNDDDRTSLHVAAYYGHNAVIQELIKRDKSIMNNQDEDGNTALHLAALEGKIKCVIILTQSGANFEIRNGKLWSPLDCACANGYPKAAQTLLEAGASVEPKGRVKIAPLHLCCQRGHVEILRLLLQWNANVKFRSPDGRNGLDYAIDYMQKPCVMELLKHRTWMDSLQNVIVDPQTKRVNTPMRKMIRTMEELAVVVCDQCITSNGKKLDDVSFQAWFNFEFIDDMYSCSEWMKQNANPTAKTDTTVMIEEGKSVYNSQDDLTAEATSYTLNGEILKSNHPLTIAVKFNCQNFLLHPLIEQILEYKWTKYSRYIAYGQITMFAIYLLLLTVFLIQIPPYYLVDWNKVLEPRFNDMSSEVTDEASDEAYQFILTCVYWIQEYSGPYEPKPAECQTFTHLNVIRLVLLVYSFLRLGIEFIQLLKNRLRWFEFSNLFEVTLYTTAALALLNFESYNLSELGSKNSYHYINDSYLGTQVFNLQEKTNLRLKWQTEVGAIALFLCWMDLLLFFQNLPYFGIYIMMLAEVFKSCMRFFSVFIFVLLAFSTSFTILFGNKAPYYNFGESLLTSFDMMVGEINYLGIFFSEDQSNYNELAFSDLISRFLFILFILLMSIVVMNLLVGLAVGDIMAIKDQAVIKRLGLQVDLILSVEFNFPMFFRKKLFKRNHKIAINKYRRANIFKKTFFDDDDLREKLRDLLNDDDDEDNNVGTVQDQIINNLTFVKGRVMDLLNDATEVKQGVTTVRGSLKDSRKENKMYSEDMENNLLQTKTLLHKNLEERTMSLAKKTLEEAENTRQEVLTTQHEISNVQESQRDASKQMEDVRSNLVQNSNNNTGNMMDFMRELRDMITQVQDNQMALKEDVKDVRLLVTAFQVENQVLNRETNERTKDHVENLLHKNANLHKDVNALQDSLQAFHTDVDNKNKVLHESIDKHIDDLTEKQATAQKSIEALQNGQNEFRAQVTSENKANQEHVDKHVNNLTDKQESVHKSIESVQSEQNDFREEVNELDATMHATIDEHVKTSTERQERIQKGVDTLQSDLHDFREETMMENKV